MGKPRPEGFNYSNPDPENTRCRTCNSDGMNRTGLKVNGYVGATVTSMYGIRCPIINCDKGLIGPLKAVEAGDGIGENHE